MATVFVRNADHHFSQLIHRDEELVGGKGFTHVEDVDLQFSAPYFKGSNICVFPAVSFHVLRQRGCDNVLFFPVLGRAFNHMLR